MNSITISLTTVSRAVDTSTPTSVRSELIVDCGIRLSMIVWGATLADKLVPLDKSAHLLVTGELNVIDGTPVLTARSITVVPVALNVNTVSLVGRTGSLTQDRLTRDSRKVSNVSLAVSRGKDNTDWFSLKMLDRTAEIASQYTNKGDQVGITGKLVFDSWHDKNTGAFRVKPVVIVDRLELLTSKKESESRVPVAA